MNFNFLFDIGNYESRKIGNTYLKNGYRVSTCYTSDEGYETAIEDQKGCHPVENYQTKNDAIEGHKKWVDLIKNNEIKVINKLGGVTWGLDNEIVYLEPSEKIMEQSKE